MTAPLERIKISGVSVAADADGLADGVNSASGVALTLAATEAGDDLAHLIIITPSGSVTGNYSLTGTDANGNVLTETLATNTTNAVTSTNYFLTLTEVLAPSGIGSETVDIGWTAVSVSPWTFLSRRMTRANFGTTIVSGTPTYSVQHTFGDDAFSHTDVTDATAAADASYTGPVRAIRIRWTVAGGVRLQGHTAAY